MKPTTYALMAVVALAAAVTVPATAQRATQATPGVFVVVDQLNITMVTPGVFRISITAPAGGHEQTRRAHTLNSKPVKLAPVKIVASRDVPPSHNE